MKVLDGIVGYASEATFSEKIHHIKHLDRVEYVTISPDDVARRRFRLKTDKGTDCAVMLNRDQKLSDGSILLLTADRAIVVRLTKRAWLSLDALDKAAALQLGYFAGNLHWKVRFDKDLIHIALEGPRQSYIDRLENQLSNGQVILCEAKDE